MANLTSFLMGGHFNRHRSLIYEECYITTTILPVFDDEQWSLNCDCFRGARVSPDSSTNPRHLMCNTLSLFYKQQFISNKLETGQIFRKNKQLTGHFLKK